MEIRWTEEAIKHLENTLDFWSKHNYSDDYSNKIIRELKQVELAIAENPYFLARFIESIIKDIFSKESFHYTMIL